MSGEQKRGRTAYSRRDESSHSLKPRFILAFVALALLLTLGLILSAALRQPDAPGVAASPTSQPPVATTATAPVEPVATLPPPAPPMEFEVARAMQHVRALEAFGPRKGGSAAEKNGAEYIREQLELMGYSAEIIEFPLTNGTTSRNVVARAQGTTETLIILGGHMDSKPPSPGANDNLTGCGALLEIARIGAAQAPTATLEFVFFGAEEMIDRNPDHHHYGSRYHLTQMTADERNKTAGMISVDMIGFGDEFVVRTMNKGPQSLRKLMVADGQAQGLPIEYLRDPGKTGWSDHEAFERAGIPVAWIEWRDDPVYHTAKDTSPHVDEDLVQTAGSFVLDFVRTLDERALTGLLDR